MTYSKAEILQAAEKLKQQLENTEEIQFYKLAEEKINANKKVVAKVAQIKALQKEAVNLEHYQKYEAMKLTEKKIDQVQAEIDNLPIVAEFRRAQAEANELLQSVTKEINVEVSESAD